MQPDPVIFAVLFVIIAASSTIFWIGVRRETVHRAQRRLDEWAEQNRFARMNVEFGPPRPLDRIGDVPMTLTVGLFGRTTKFVHLRVPPSPDSGGVPTHWNLAIRRMNTASAPAGLRATEATRSILDFFKLEVSARQTAAGRFTILGDDLIATRRLADGSSRALLPGDVSLLRIDEFLVLDFSGRPFDPIELTRMLAILDQLAAVV